MPLPCILPSPTTCSTVSPRHAGRRPSSSRPASRSGRRSCRRAATATCIWPRLALQHLGAMLRVRRLLGELRDLLRRRSVFVCSAWYFAPRRARASRSARRARSVSRSTDATRSGEPVGLERRLRSADSASATLSSSSRRASAASSRFLLELLLRGVGLVLHRLELAHQLRRIERDDRLARLDLVAFGRDAARS